MLSGDTLPILKSTTILLSDQEIRLRCMDYATRDTNNIDPLLSAKEMYEWVMGQKEKASTADA